MIHLTEKTKIRVAIKPTDFRKQIDGLVAQCKNQYQENPRDGVIYVFINRAQSMIRLLHYDGSGYWIATKRLSQGKFQHWPKSTQGMSSVQASELKKIMLKN